MMNLPRPCLLPSPALFQDGKTALDLAQSDVIVSTLLKANAAVGSLTPNNWLLSAAENGDMKLLERALQADANMDYQDKVRWP